jgi:glycosyltransferase involved in cell wall biosynthesis
MNRGSILVLTPWSSVFDMAGGGTPRIFDLVNTLLDAGYFVDVVAPAAKEREQDWFPAHHGLRVHRYRSPATERRGRLGVASTWLGRTIRLTIAGLGVSIRHGRPKAIYALSSLAIPAGVVCGFLLRRPTIGALFGTYLRPHLSTRRERLSHFEEIVAFKSPVDRLLIVNDGTQGDEVARILGVSDARVRFWMHGLDLQACEAAKQADARSELELPATAPLVVSASRLASWKRVDRILRAAPEVLAANPDTVFALSGEGSERHFLEELANELSIAHAVRFLGGLPRDVNLRLIASADVFCSLYDYSCVGVALLEALGCGIAVVVADTGATRDFVEDEVNGLVLKSKDDAHETARAILRLLNDRPLRARLGGEAHRLAKDRFLTPKQRASLELETIAELIGADDA